MQAWFIAEGRLAYADTHGAIHTVESAFANDAIERAERAQRVDGWKTAPREDSQGIIPSNALWGRSGGSGPMAPPRFQYAVRADDDSIFYVLTVGGSTGLFRYYPEDKREIRLFHGGKFPCLGLAYDPGRKGIIMAVGNPDGTASLEFVDTEGRRKGQITGGDSIDAAPAPSAREVGVVYYQSAGVARHPQHGYVAAIGPAAINRLDYKAGRLETVLEHRDYDYLTPKEDRGGNLWYIRRPYEKTATESAASLGKDVLLMPWRLLKGIFGYLNFFTTIYGREPLRSSGGPNMPKLEQDLGELWLHGRLIALRQVRYDAERGGGLVPASWELVCRNRNGQEYVAARNVVSFDIAPDDTVVCSNGFDVYRLANGEWRKLAKGSLVETVCAVAGAAPAG